MTIIRETYLLHPKFRRAVEALGQDLARAYETGVTKTNFKVFETFRDPRRQADLLAKRVTKAGFYQSAHAFGLAADFVPFLTPDEADALAQRKGERVLAGWNWDSSHDFRFLAERAAAFELSVPISWDLVHVQHPQFDAILKAMNNLKHL